MRKTKQSRAGARARTTDPSMASHLESLLNISPTGDLGAVVNPREARANATIKIPIGPGKYVVARRLDMTTMVFEGLLPLPLLTAVEKLRGLQDLPPAERLKAFQQKDENRDQILDMLRSHAAAVCKEPVVCWPDDDNPDHLPADALNLAQLMLIWNETALIPVIAPDDAGRFRHHPTPAPAPAPSRRESLRPTSEPVGGDADGTERFIHG